ncbi:MAG: DUF4177 domain-containing protein [Lewinella sp.]
MNNYEYKSIKIKGKFRSQEEVNLLDQTINDSAKNGWELVTTTSLSNRLFSEAGRTSGILLTFKRERDN